MHDELTQPDDASTSRDPTPGSAARESDDLATEQLTPEQESEAKEYGRLTLRLTLLDMALDFVFLAVFALLLAKPIDDCLQQLPWLRTETGGWWEMLVRSLRLCAFIVVYLVLHATVSIGLSFYRGYIVEHRYGLSNQSIGRWLSQYGKGIALTAVANVIVLVGLYWIMWLCGGWWWVAAAAAAFVAAVLIGYIAPILILPLFVKYEPLDDDTLQKELSQLAEGTGLTIEGTYRLLLSADTKKANAMLAGLGRTRRVLLGDTLLENFTTDEIKVVMAHEIGHHVYGHIYKMLLLSLPYTLVAFFLCNLALGLWVPDYHPASLPVYAVGMLMFLIFVLGAITAPLQNGLMRHFERQCDRYALVQTKLASAYRSAFIKLARLNKADTDPHWLEVFLFDDHPPIAKRLAMADEVDLTAKASTSSAE